MKLSDVLTEMVWSDGFSAAKDAKRFPSDWIHFSNIDKIGVNPKAQHRDPPGIYFYPCKWLFTEDSALSQFATEFPYYFVVKIKRSPDFVNLGKMTIEQVEQIAASNGWGDDLQRIRSNPSLLTRAGQPMDLKLIKKPGGLFYAAADFLVNEEKKYSWLKLLRGVAGLSDPGHGIIARGEPAQAIVIDRTLMRVVAQGVNKDQRRSNYGALFKQAVEKCGGQFTYQNKIPTGVVTRDNRSVKVELDYGGFRLRATINQDGHLVTNTEKYDNIIMNTGDNEFNLKCFVSFIERNLKLSSPGTGKSVYWNRDLINAVAKGLRPDTTRYNEVVKDGVFKMSYLGGFGHVQEGIWIKTDGTTLTIRVVAETSDWEANIEQTFASGTPADTVVRQLGNALWTSIKPNLPPNMQADRARIGKIFHFNLGE